MYSSRRERTPIYKHSKPYSAVEELESEHDDFWKALDKRSDEVWKMFANDIPADPLSAIVTKPDNLEVTVESDHQLNYQEVMRKVLKPTKNLEQQLNFVVDVRTWKKIFHAYGRHKCIYSSSYKPTTSCLTTINFGLPKVTNSLYAFGSLYRACSAIHIKASKIKERNDSFSQKNTTTLTSCAHLH